MDYPVRLQRREQRTVGRRSSELYPVLSIEGQTVQVVLEWMVLVEGLQVTGLHRLASENLSAIRKSFWMR